VDSPAASQHSPRRAARVIRSQPQRKSTRHAHKGYSQGCSPQVEYGPRGAQRLVARRISFSIVAGLFCRWHSTLQGSLERPPPRHPRHAWDCSSCPVPPSLPRLGPQARDIARDFVLIDDPLYIRQEAGISARTPAAGRLPERRSTASSESGSHNIHRNGGEPGVTNPKLLVEQIPHTSLAHHTPQSGAEPGRHIARSLPPWRSYLRKRPSMKGSISSSRMPTGIWWP
jgi:hypothetical protein